MSGRDWRNRWFGSVKPFTVSSSLKGSSKLSRLRLLLFSTEGDRSESLFGDYCFDLRRSADLCTADCLDDSCDLRTGDADLVLLRVRFLPCFSSVLPVFFPY